MKFTIGHVVMPSIEYGGDVLITPSNKSCKNNDQIWLVDNNNWPSLWIFNYFLTLYCAHSMFINGGGGKILNACFI